MADSENRTDVINRRKMVREAFMLLITNDDIRDITLDALEMATDKNEKPELRLKAKEFIFKYMMPLPKQELDITSDNQGITGYTFEIVKANEKES